MMSRINFDDICRMIECENYIEWEHDYVLEDYNTRHETSMTCVSCTKVGESYNIEEYPDDCPHKEALAKYAIKREKEIKAFEFKHEQEKIWKRLNEVNS